MFNFQQLWVFYTFLYKKLYKSSVLCYNAIRKSMPNVSTEKIWLQHNTNYVSAAGFGGFFYNISRIFSMRRRCSVPVEMI